MAIPIPKEHIIDSEENKFIGIKLPIVKSDGREGYFESTEITFDAVKENIRNLLNTRTGERVFQPSLGIGLDDFLFENINGELISIMEDQIRGVFDTWMPFVTIRSLDVRSGNNDVNKLFINIEFFLNQNPNVLDSIQITVG